MRLESLLDSPDAFGIRHADAAVIAGHMWREQATEAAASADNGLFVAIDETGSWVGTAGATTLEGVPDTAHLRSVYVTPGHRGQDGACRLNRTAQTGPARILRAGPVQGLPDGY